MSDEQNDFTFTPIGIYHSEAVSPYEAARQPLDRITARGEIHLQPGQQYEQALEDLEGVERLWLVYVFHHNTNWKPKVMPPRGSDHKIGVFATRAPYRPNPIGLSCVKLIKVEGLKLILEGADLLDGSPILDIKPYLPYADSHPDSATGWLGTPQNYQVKFSPQASEQLSFLREQGLAPFKDFIINQLEYDPIEGKKKRVWQEDESYILAYKTWRARFILNEATKESEVVEIFSGYGINELADPQDPYQDKDLHKLYKEKFP